MYSSYLNIFKKFFSLLFFCCPYNHQYHHYHSLLCPLLAPSSFLGSHFWGDNFNKYNYFGSIYLPISHAYTPSLSPLFLSSCLIIMFLLVSWHSFLGFTYYGGTYDICLSWACFIQHKGLQIHLFSCKWPIFILFGRIVLHCVGLDPCRIHLLLLIVILHLLKKHCCCETACFALQAGRSLRFFSPEGHTRTWPRPPTQRCCPSSQDLCDAHTVADSSQDTSLTV